MGDFVRNHKLARLRDAAGNGTGVLHSDPIDCQGFREVTFLCIWGNIEDGTPRIMAQGGDTENGSFSNLENTSVSIELDQDKEITWLTIKQPRHRWARLKIERGGSTGSGVNAVVGILGEPEVRPVVQDDTISGGEFHFRPPTGTA